MQIGTNHGALSDRIMNRYADTQLGMVESALEFARIARDLDYHAFVFSMKSSNPKVMIAAYRLLVARLSELDAEVGGQRSEVSRDEALRGPISDLRPPTSDSWNYPIHLGVTEAGEGEDARIKSAIGIGSLLRDGIGDTIRVSLTEDSIHEIPVAKALVAIVATTSSKLQAPSSKDEISFDPFSYSKRPTETIERQGVRLGGEELIRVVVRQENFDKVAHKIDRLGDYKPEIVYEKARVHEIDPRDDDAVRQINEQPDAQLVTVGDEVELPVIVAFRLLASRLAPRHAILLKDELKNDEARMMNDEGSSSDRMTKSDSGSVIPSSFDIRHSAFLQTLLKPPTIIGWLLAAGIGNAVMVQGEEAPGQGLRLSYNILQAAGSRIFKTDY